MSLALHAPHARTRERFLALYEITQGTNATQIAAATGRHFLGYGWTPVGERLWVNTRSPGLSKRVTFYGLYIWTEARVHIWDYERANGEHTIDVLRRLRQRYPGRMIRDDGDGIDALTRAFR